MDLLASGRDSDVYAYGEGRVLRRYRDGRAARTEYDLLRALGRSGFPVPQVESTDGPDIVMAYVEGPTLAAAVLSGLVTPSGGGAVLAGLHARLHGSPTAEDVLIHLDLHPANVLLGADGPVVIDWCNARRGPAGLDVAMTALILAQVSLTPGLMASDPVRDPAARAAVRSLLGAFASDVPHDYVDHLAEAAAIRQLDRNQSARELALIAPAADLARLVAR